MEGINERGKSLGPETECEKREMRNRASFFGSSESSSVVYCNIIEGECKYPTMSQNHCPVYQGHFGEAKGKKGQKVIIEGDYTQIPPLSTLY